MTQMRVKMDAQTDKKLLRDASTGWLLRATAEKVKDRVRLPSRDLSLSVRAGIGPRGAFSQVIMTGPGALAVEFGSRRHEPKAPLRAALRSIR